MKNIGILFGIMIAVFGVSGIVLPTNFIVENTVTVNESRFVVFNKIRLLKSHKDWNPWIKKDPSIIYHYKGVDGAEGFISHWVGNNEVGEGEQKIKKILEGERIDYDIRLKSPRETINHSSLITTEEGDLKTKLTWKMNVRVNFPYNVIFKILKKQEKLEYDLQEGTNVLKAIIEKDSQV